MKAVGLAVALAASNFLYQAATSHDWSTALERSFFQAVAVGLAAVMLRRRSQHG